MTRKQLLVGLLAVAGLAVGLAATAAAGTDGATASSLDDRIHDQAQATEAALAAAENVWAPRVGGLGVGLAVGLLGGGLLAYAGRGDGG